MRLAVRYLLATVAVAVLVTLAALLRLGVLPLSTGMVWSLGRGVSLTSLLGALPLGGVVLLVRIAPELPELLAVGRMALLAGVPVAAALAIVQRSPGRSLGYLMAASHGLIVVGALDPSPAVQLGAELLWAGTLLSAAGVGAALTLVELRLEGVDLWRHHGLQADAPMLSAAFLLQLRKELVQRLSLLFNPVKIGIKLFMPAPQVSIQCCFPLPVRLQLVLVELQGIGHFAP